jgi:hypothetical protein
MKPIAPDQLPTALARHMFETLRFRTRLYVRAKELAEADPALEPLRIIALAGLEDTRHQLALALLATAPGAPHAARRFGRYLAVATADADFGRPTLRVLLLPAFVEDLIRQGGLADLAEWRPTPPGEAPPEAGE